MSVPIVICITPTKLEYMEILPKENSSATGNLEEEIFIPLSTKFSKLNNSIGDNKDFNHTYSK